MERSNFIFYKEYKEAIDCLKNEKTKLKLYEAITDYALYNITPIKQDKEVFAIFMLIKSKLDKNNKSYWSYEDRRSSKYKKWKEQVLKKYDFKCQICGSKNNLVVHHIQSFANNEDLRYDIENGITLCQNCHKEVHKNER